MPERSFIPLSMVTRGIQKILNPHLGRLFWVKAEISSGHERGGTFYCNLVETDANSNIIAQIRCIIWNNNLARIRRQFKGAGLELKLEEGTAVGFQCAIQYHPRYGLSLTVVDADPAFVLGELELRKQQILDRLEKEGLLKTNKELAVPMLPQRIGLISSIGSAAYNDVLKTLHGSAFGFKILVADTIVQGDHAEQSMITALSLLEKLNVELVLIIRGGGSKTDLFYLDNEVIARKIAGYSLPVWTGIGHETDTSILDHVANRNFKTPTAVAEEIVARFIATDRRLAEAKHRFKSVWRYRLEVSRKWLSDSGTGIRQGTRKLLDATRTDLRNLANSQRAKVFDRLANENKRMSVAKKTILTAPQNILSLSCERIQNRQQRYVNVVGRCLIEKRNILQGFQKRFLADRFYRHIEQSRKSLNEARMVIQRGSQNLFNSTTGDLRNRAMVLRSRVSSRVASENMRLSVSEKLVCAAPFRIVHSFQERLAGRREKFIAVSNRCLKEEEKHLAQLLEKFPIDRLEQRIQREHVLLIMLRNRIKKILSSDLNMKSQALAYLKSRFRQELVLSRIQTERKLIRNKLSALRAADPKTSLARGFSLVYKQDGTLIKSIVQVDPGEITRTDLVDGQILGTVNSIKEKTYE